MHCARFIEFLWLNFFCLYQALLPASSLLQMSLVREACCKFLLRQLHPTNCLGIRNFADTHACKELQTRSHRFALQNFPEVMNTEEFVLLPLEEVRMHSPIIHSILHGGRSGRRNIIVRVFELKPFNKRKDSEKAIGNTCTILCAFPPFKYLLTRLFKWLYTLCRVRASYCIS